MQLVICFFQLLFSKSFFFSTWIAFSMLESLSKNSTLCRLLGPDIIAKGILHIHKAGMTPLGDLIYGFKLLVGEGDEFGVALNTRGVGALGQHGVAATQAPGNEDLGEGDAFFVGDGVELGVRRDLLAGAGDLVLRAERRVSDGDDVVRQAEVDELGVGEERVNFDLVDSGRDLGVLEQRFKVFDRPVGDADGARFAGFVELFRCAPCWLGIRSELFLDYVL